MAAEVAVVVEYPVDHLGAHLGAYIGYASTGSATSFS